MSILQDYYAVLDSSDYDSRNENDINISLKEIELKLKDSGALQESMYAEIDRQALLLRKSFDEPVGLKWAFSGKHLLEDGTEVNFVWPNHTEFSESYFEYIWKRYNEVKNPYLKTEYGLVLFFAGKPKTAKHQHFKLTLCDELTSLAKLYFNKLAIKDENSNYLLYFIRTIKGALYIANKNNKSRFDEIAEYLFHVHQTWDISKKGSLRTIIDIPSILLLYPETKRFINFDAILKKNVQAAIAQAKNYLWGAIYIADASLKITQRTGVTIDFDWNRFKGQIYESLFEETKARSDFGALKMLEEALSIYKQLGDEIKVLELEKAYQELRGKLAFAQIDEKLPQEYTHEIIKNIATIVRERSSREILDIFMNAQMFGDMTSIQNTEEEIRKNTVILSMLPITTVDKFGNNTAHYENEGELNSVFWQAYSFDFQIGYQNLIQLFWKSFHNGKLSYEKVSDYLSNTWYNEIILREYNGQDYDIRPLDILMPPIKLMFDELNRWKSDDEYVVNIVAIEDSLVLKLEAMLRYLFSKMNISTFRQYPAKNIVMEKNIDDLLNDLRGIQNKSIDTKSFLVFLEEDRLFIKYVMAEKIGLNLRNRTAHGLLDIFEYNFNEVILVFSIILRLCKYEFTTNDDEA